MSANDLIAFWNQMDFSSGPYVHPEDKATIEERFKVAGLTTLEEVERSIDELKWNNNKLHTQLLPQPYKGDLKNADTFILLTNPGASPIDYYAQHKVADFRQTIIGQTKQSNTEFTGLNPKWYWTATFQWWRPKFEKLVIQMVKKEWASNYAEALKQIRTRIAVVELIPYPSKSSPSKYPLASSNEAKNFVRSLPEEKSLMIMRSERDWDVPSTRKNVYRNPSTNARNITLNPEYRAGKFLLNRLDPAYCAKT